MAESNSKKNDHRSVLKIGPIVIFGWPLPIAHKKSVLKNQYALSLNVAEMTGFEPADGFDSIT